MPLFQPSVVKTYLSQLDDAAVQSAWQAFQSYFGNLAIQQNIRDSKEEQFQEGFLRELFGKVFGYTLYPEPEFNLLTELKNVKDSKKADGAIVHNRQVIAVIELKDTKVTDLAKIEQQAFGYKNNQRGCTYVVTANFEKLRFYVEDAIDFEEFNLFTLNAERFRLLYLCLSLNSLLAGIPATVKAASTVEEENITKKLYADYSGFKRLLFADVLKQNPQYEPLLLFRKTQKLLDRFLFILFAEDRALLPHNSISEILNQWQTLKDLDEDVPLYSRFKKYFGYLNTGHKDKKHDIFAYNGGLFAPDEVLDTLAVDDQILYEQTAKLTRYDFETDVDVNILGHIFEHSLSEIEEITAGSEGRTIAYKDTKRKRDGVFYTPKYITQYIVRNTLGTLCNVQKQAFRITPDDFTPDQRKAKKRELLARLDAYRAWLLTVTVLDPACGSGAFLNEALDYLISEHRQLDEMNASLLGIPLVLSDVENSILENNIYGVDLNDESIEIAKLSLWLRTARRGRKLSSLNRNIKVGNSLVADITVGGEKAFDWSVEFADVFNKGGFDIVIGNPPYVRADSPGNSLAFRSYMINRSGYNTLTGKWDLYLPFIELSIMVLKEGGFSSLIIPDAYCHANYAQLSLKWLQDNKYLSQIDYFPGIEVFENVGVKSVIISNTKRKFQGFNQVIHQSITGDYVEYRSEYYPNSFRVDFRQSFIAPQGKGFVNIEQVFYISKGIVGNSDEKHYKGEFEVSDLISKVSDTLHPKLYYEGKDIQKWYLANRRWIEYGTDRSPKKWSRKVFADFFEGSSKIVAMRSPGVMPRLFLDIEGGYFNESAIGLKRWTDLKGVNNNSISGSYESEIKRKELEIISEQFSYGYLLAILNSKFIMYELNTNRRSNIHIYPDDYRKLMIPVSTKENREKLEEKAETMINQNESLKRLKNQFFQLLRLQIDTLTVSRKLDDWPGLSFKDFIAEITKQKVKLSLSQQAEWMQFLTEQQAKARLIQGTLDQTEQEINQLVYQLYNLTDEEIAVVEGKQLT